MTVVCVKKYQRTRSSEQIAEVIRQELLSYPEIVRSQVTAQGGMGGGGNSTVDVEIYGYSFDETNVLAEQVRNLIMDKVPNARDVTISRDKDRPELNLVIDKEKASSFGLNAATVSTYVRNRVAGLSAGYLKEDGEEYDIVVRLREQDRNSLSDIVNLSIPTATGKTIKLSEIASVEEYFAPPTISRKSRQRYLTVSVMPYNTSLGQLASQVQDVISQVNVPEGITMTIGGDFEDQQEMFGNIIPLALLIILLVYVVMASQFESFSKPAIILLAIPFAITGVILALWITGTTLDMIAALGVVMLIGIVVKNGIVLVDYINLMRDRGYELVEAIALSGRSRLRPVMMTAMTTILSKNSDRNKQERNRKNFIFMQLAADSNEEE